MKTRYLFKHSYKKIGWILLISGVILGITLLLNDFEYPSYEIKVWTPIKSGALFKSDRNHIIETNIFSEITTFLITIGGLLVAFSKEKIEDEYIQKIRVESLIWATFVNYIILLIATLLLFDFNFLTFMAINMFSLLLLFIIKFKWELYRLKRMDKNEK